MDYLFCRPRPNLNDDTIEYYCWMSSTIGSIKCECGCGEGGERRVLDSIRVGWQGCPGDRPRSRQGSASGECSALEHSGRKTRVDKFVCLLMGKEIEFGRHVTMKLFVKQSRVWDNFGVILLLGNSKDVHDRILVEVLKEPKSFKRTYIWDENLNIF